MILLYFKIYCNTFIIILDNDKLQGDVQSMIKCFKIKGVYNTDINTYTLNSKYNFIMEDILNFSVLIFVSKYNLICYNWYS